MSFSGSERTICEIKNDTGCCFSLRLNHAAQKINKLQFDSLHKPTSADLRFVCITVEKTSSMGKIIFSDFLDDKGKVVYRAKKIIYKSELGDFGFVQTAGKSSFRQTVIIITFTFNLLWSRFET